MNSPIHISYSRLVNMLRDAGIRPSLQRLRVLATVANSGLHPSADEIFTKLSAECPTLSKTTVYNALHTMAQAGIIMEIGVDNGCMRYDIAVHPAHSHFVCRRCSRIFDMRLPDNIADALADGFESDCVELTFKGLCPECRKSH